MLSAVGWFFIQIKGRLRQHVFHNLQELEKDHKDQILSWLSAAVRFFITRSSGLSESTQMGKLGP